MSGGDVYELLHGVLPRERLLPSDPYSYVTIQGPTGPTGPEGP